MEGSYSTHGPDSRWRGQRMNGRLCNRRMVGRALVPWLSQSSSNRRRHRCHHRVPLACARCERADIDKLAKRAKPRRDFVIDVLHPVAHEPSIVKQSWQREGPRRLSRARERISPRTSSNGHLQVVCFTHNVQVLQSCSSVSVSHAQPLVDCVQERYRGQLGSDSW